MKRLVCAFLFTSLGGCVVETPSEEDAEKRRRLLEIQAAQSYSQQPTPVNCRYSSNQGCISGALIASPELTLNDHTYFDAEEIGFYLSRTLQLDEGTLEKLNLAEYNLQFSPPINNQNFVQGFSIYLKGPTVVQARVQRDGSFQFDNLRAGEYEVRAQKTFTMKLEGLDYDGVAVQKTICLTIYSSQSKVELRPRMSSFLPIENYYMKMNSTHCSQEEEPLPIIIDF